MTIVQDNQLVIVLIGVHDPRMFESLLHTILSPIEQVFEKIGIKTTTVGKKASDFCITWTFQTDANVQLASLLLSKGIAHFDETIAYSFMEVKHWGRVVPEGYQEVCSYEHFVE